MSCIGVVAEYGYYRRSALRLDTNVTNYGTALT